MVACSFSAVRSADSGTASRLVPALKRWATISHPLRGLFEAGYVTEVIFAVVPARFLGNCSVVWLAQEWLTLSVGFARLTRDFASAELSAEICPYEQS
jgi:hypothetical protein